MPDPSLAERRQLLVDMTFASEAFTVSKGDKTQRMIDVENFNIAQAAKVRQAAGQPPSPAPKGFMKPPPNPIPVGGLSLLAGVLKYLIEDDQQLLADTKIRFKAHFANVLTNGVLVLHPACDAEYDAAIPQDVGYHKLITVGMDKGGRPAGIDTLAKWVKSNTFGALMPTGQIADNFHVLVKLLQWDESLIGGKLEWDSMNCCLTVNRERVEDNVTSGHIRVNMGERYFVPYEGKNGVRSFCPSDSHTIQAMEHIARQNKFHASQEYFYKVRPIWDKTSRIEDSLRAIGCLKPIDPNLPQNVQDEIKKRNDLAISQWRKQLIGTVARTMEPGCQMDTMLIFKSKQGTKKSSTFRMLAPANKFSSTHFDFGSKDSRIIFQQNTWLEIAELSAYQKKDIQLVKAEITERSDDFRLPYGRNATRNPRHCVFFGSTNDDTFLRDPTGSRRFWVIVVEDDKRSDVAWLEANKDQLWAEIVQLYEAGFTCPHCIAAADGEVRCPDHRWWLSQAEETLREKVNQTFAEAEPYVEWLQGWLANAISDKKAKQGMHTAKKNTDELKVHELLEEVGLPAEKCHERHQQNRMIQALKTCGYVQKHTETGNLWVSPGMQNRPALSVVTPPAAAADPQTKPQGKTEDKSPEPLKTGSEEDKK